ncbi:MULTISPECIES: sulfurtransferase TusA family protein [Acidianus]|uniref:Response regulator SirA n=1 Tax=Candidatus Acidianus copahuensis TaxID=1160895 RepID=A0A031LJD6_9CREN|nr:MULTISPECIES: sulfurtransferase TusA family protein [Acidianus]EZQ02254.1 response regulator SirA [Candidatus Acidianus copahuensis]NON61930.1 sulfurtransferase TusA family protein [Acidianus sp. RZ1]
MSSMKISSKLDLTGYSCAGPIGELSGVLDTMKDGEAVEAILADESTKKDVLAWAQKKGYKVIEEKKDGNKFIVVIGK